ncbi:TetR/AcrR family transcriptional regulator [Mechercharimyces sp. CAU 1602]|uniref:TetR/AcrR family transcriptional regulator n=1 Tax=Mechercharimyces sp. CAU 1602 TaxID=2973933 RepID=UPI0021626CA3|nr:TetR/AcrR family transcriptional regulator [Mechercharimyces sp. CAU 1602]MCS1349987.1 TetR family transcriptional regulator [Mechercharimyces sp. CAU 1602]
MPKQVDHEQRKKKIAEATWRIIYERGVEGASVRNIAAEANISLGSLRHYFPTQEELLRYAMEVVKERVKARMMNIVSGSLSLQEQVLQLVLQMIPTDEESMAEMKVWYSFISHFSQKEKEFQIEEDGIYQGLHLILKQLEHRDMLCESVDVEVEAERLYALVDGLAIHVMLNPQRLSYERIVLVVKTHLHSLYREGICKE